MKSKEEILEANIKRYAGFGGRMYNNEDVLKAMEEYASQAQSEILDALILLQEEAPREIGDADWWEDSFKRAMENAGKVIDKYLPEVKTKP
jgi:hypothetical protein